MKNRLKRFATNLLSLVESLFLSVSNHLPRLGFFDRKRYFFLKLAGLVISGKPAIWAPITIRPIGKASNISIGKGTFINTNSRFGCPQAKISIGNNVMIGPNVSFETVNHGLIYVEGKGRGMNCLPIEVEDEVWIGAGVIIIQGVTVGKGAVITAGAVVINDVEPYTVYGGVPAKKIKSIEVVTNEKDI